MLNIENAMEGRREGRGGKSCGLQDNAEHSVPHLADHYPSVSGSPIELGNDWLGQFCNADVD